VKIPPRDHLLGTLSYRLIRLPDREYTFQGNLLHADAKRIVVTAPIVPSKPLVIDGQEVIAEDYRAIWFLFNGKPWDVGCMYRPDGTFTGYYADVLETVRWEGEDATTLQPLVDLFLDLWVGANGVIQVLDEDEFEEARKSGSLTARQASHAQAVLADLVIETETGGFPPGFVRDFRPESCRERSKHLPTGDGCSTVLPARGGSE
jgi:predicted RNA-binding protein associated with RNAse of E/G family